MANFFKKIFRGKSQEVPVAEPEAALTSPTAGFTDVVLTAPDSFGYDRQTICLILWICQN